MVLTRFSRFAGFFTRSRYRSVVMAAAPVLPVLIVVLVGAWHGASAQLVPYNVKYNSGQNVQPVFEGWSRNQDGAFTLHFGYLNRNYVEDVHVPVGPNNQIEPAGPDRGQPTYFYTRINRYAFTVTVPKDWDKTREVVWTLTANGKTDKAHGWLQPDWEVDASVRVANTIGGRLTEPDNKPPVLKIDNVPALTSSSAGTLTARVTDDGLPKPGAARRRAATGQETPPTLQNMPEAPVNVPQIQRGAGVGGRRSGPPAGLSVSWIVWRGPAGATFEPQHAPVKDGKAVTTATFVKPGEYVLRARASDGPATTDQDLKVTVTGQPSSSPR
jgi:hypothetical protein